jgi:hypothetical protein
MEFSSLGKFLMLMGGVLFVIGLGVTLGPKIPFIGKLPGDIHIERDGFNFSFPIVTCIVVSVVGSVILNIFFKK